MYEDIEGKYVLGRAPWQVKPVGDDLKIQGRFKHLDVVQEAALQEQVDRNDAELQRQAAIDVN